MKITDLLFETYITNENIKIMSPEEFVATVDEDDVEESQSSDMRDFFSKQQPLNPTQPISNPTGPTVARITRQSEDVAEVTKQSAIKQYKDIQDYKHTERKPKPKDDEKEFLRISIGQQKRKAKKEEDQGVAEGSEEGNLYAMALQRYPQLKRVDRETVINALNGAYEDYLMHYGYEGIGPDEERSLIDYAVKGLKRGVAEGLDPYQLERLDPQTRRVLIRMAKHAEPGSWLSAAESYAMQLGLQHKNKDPRAWEQEVQYFVDLYRQYSGQGVAEGFGGERNKYANIILSYTKNIDIEGDHPEGLLSGGSLRHSLGRKSPTFDKLSSQYYGDYDNMVRRADLADLQQIAQDFTSGKQGVAEGSGDAKYKVKIIGKDKKGDYYVSPNTGKKVYKQAKVGDHETPSGEVKPKVTESILESRKGTIFQGIKEATKLPADQRELGGQEFQDYMQRIVGTPDIDKKTGQVKLDKKGKEKYVSGKTKQDKYKLPYMHRSSVVKYYDSNGKRFREEQVIEALKQRPKKLLKQNEKMKHSNGELEQFFNVGFAALVGIAVDESKDKLVVVNTCPGAGSCKVDCFAMKGGKIQFEAAWLSDGRILTYLLNDPDTFFSQLSGEISKEEQAGQKGNYRVSIRWHDAGDFFSPEYFDLAMRMAKQHPNVKFYAYTKIAGAALADKPENFIINWSEGAHTSQEKKVKQADPRLMKTKNSRIVPTDAFDDLLVKDAKGNLVKGEEGQWQIQPDKIRELKQRLAQLYQLSPNSILTYDEYVSKPKIANMRYNVIVAPGEGDISANDRDVISTLLLKH